jgi:hypothetical protein
MRTVVAAIVPEPDSAKKSPFAGGAGTCEGPCGKIEILPCWIIGTTPPFLNPTFGVN